MYVSRIQPGNKALEFIDRRIADPKYRGSESSEHNRYDMEEIYQTLLLLNKYAPNKSLLQMRTTDLTKRPENIPEERDYALFCGEVKEKVGKGTQDSIRKLIFVDLHRMGLINRYNSNKLKLRADSGGIKKYVALTDEGIKFINSDLLNRAFIFAKALDRLLGGYLEISLDILRDSDYGIDTITKYEFMFFVSAIDTDTSFSISVDKCIELINAYRRLARTQQKAVVETLKNRLQPHLFEGDKTDKRDWHNWQNKIDQAYHLFNQTPYFNVTGVDRHNLSLSTGKIRTRTGEIVDIQKRSSAEKHEYMQKHKVSKTVGFELHHVVPLSWSESPEQYKLFDKWENMVYIDALNHARITQNGNRNIIMSADKADITLSDFNDNDVTLINKKNILYNPSKQPIMLDYNEQLRTTI